MDTETWNSLMDSVVAEHANYAPGTVMPPGPGTEGGDPMGLEYIGMGPLAFVLNEAVDAACNSGGDRDALLDSVADAAGDDFSRAEVDAILAGEQKCPEPALLSALCSAVAIDMDIAIDAAQRGGCKNYGASTIPPGY